MGFSVAVSGVCETPKELDRLKFHCRFSGDTWPESVGYLFKGTRSAYRAVDELRCVLQYTGAGLCRPIIAAIKVCGRVKVPVHRHFDDCPLEPMRSGVRGVEDEMTRNEVDAIEGGFVDGAIVVVEAVRKTVDMGGDVGLSRKHALVQELLVQLESLFGYIRIFGVLLDRPSLLRL